MRKFTTESVPYMCADLNNQRGSRSRDHQRIQIYANIVGRYKFAPLVKLNVCICLSIFSPELWPASGYFAGWGVGGGAHLLAFKCQLPPPSSPALQRWPISCLFAYRLCPNISTFIYFGYPGAPVNRVVQLIWSVFCDESLSEYLSKP